MSKYTVVNAHHARRCHPETCSCRTDYVIKDEGGMIISDAETEKEGEELIVLLEKDDAWTL